MKPNLTNYLTFTELIQISESDLGDNNFKIAAEFLLSAINDWPTYNLKEPAELIMELKQEIKGKLTYERLDNYSKTDSNKKDPWKIEAVSSLLEMFDFERKCNYDKTVDLESIIELITKHYRKK